MLATPTLRNLNQLGYRVRSFLSKKQTKESEIQGWLELQSLESTWWSRKLTPFTSTHAHTTLKINS